ncbi:MAG: ATP-binding protein [Cyanobacteria bacterium P01_D01_bin.44]
MPRWFNTAGPCNPAHHYMLPATERLPQVKGLIAEHGYFVIHAPRQTGKTTAMLALAQQLTDSGEYAAVWVSAETAGAYSSQSDIAEITFLDELRDAALSLPEALQPPPWPEAAIGRRVGAGLRAWASTIARPLVIFIDEIDSLEGTTLISILRQLRTGYIHRPKFFPQSIALIGLRDVRDYKVAAGGSQRLNTASPFNIKVESLTLRDFMAKEVAMLYAQHTQDTGQLFTAEAIENTYRLTQGQPWLVNALARQLVKALVCDPAIAITAEHVNQAKESLIQRQDTHIDSLAERLREPRVKAIIEPILAGRELGNISPDDRQYVVDLGLVKRDPQGGFIIANPIYREILPRVLARGPQDSLPSIQPLWLTPEGTLNAERLLEAFLSFWRQHGQPLLNSAPYAEIAPHLVMMAFLHRVVNGGGQLEREYAIGSDRMDLCLRYGQVTLAMELKVWREGRPDPLKVGLAQLDKYLAELGLAQGWLVIFDQRPGLSALCDRTQTEAATTPGGRAITVIRG